MTLWMEISQDRYELPLAVATSAKELARMVGSTPSIIYSELSQFRAGRLRSCRWVHIHA